MANRLAVYLKRRLERIQARHNFDPGAGAAQVRALAADVAAAYGEFRALLGVLDRLPARDRPPVPHDPRGLRPARRRRDREARPVHLYLARKDDTTLWKIGSSIVPSRRVRAVQTGNDGSLHLVHVVEGVDGRAVERRLKRALRKRKTRDRNDPQKGEWFDLPPAYVSRLVKRLRAGKSIASLKGTR